MHRHAATEGRRPARAAARAVGRGRATPLFIASMRLLMETRSDCFEQATDTPRPTALRCAALRCAAQAYSCDAVRCGDPQCTLKRSSAALGCRTHRQRDAAEGGIESQGGVVDRDTVRIRRLDLQPDDTCAALVEGSAPCKGRFLLFPSQAGSAARVLLGCLFGCLFACLFACSLGWFVCLFLGVRSLRVLPMRRSLWPAPFRATFTSSTLTCPVRSQSVYRAYSGK